MSRRTLELLALVVTGLALLVLADRPPAGLDAVPDRLFPGLAPAHVARVALGGPGRPPLVLERSGERFLLQPGALPADDEAVADVLGTLELLAYRRRVPAGAAAARGLDAPRLTLTLTDTDGSERVLRVGAPEPLLGRTWVTLGGRDDFLVEDHAVRALDRRPDDLRRRAVFDGAAAPRELALAAGDAAVALRGSPACVVLDGGCAAADRAAVSALRQHLGDVVLTRFLPAAPSAPATLHVTVDDAFLAATAAACPDAPDERQVQSSLGPGCVSARVLGELGAAVRPRLAWVEPAALALAGGDVDRVEVGGLVLVRKGGGWQNESGGVVDGEAVRGWLAGLASFRGRPAPAPLLAAPPPGALIITVAAGDRRQRLVLLPGVAAGAAVVRRDDEPVALAVHPGLRALFQAGPATFAERTLQTFEPTALAELSAEGPGALVERAVRGVTAERFALIAPLALEADLAQVAALRDLGANLRAARVLALARGLADGLAPPHRRVTFVTDPPIGRAQGGRYVVELGAPVPEGGCRAARGGEGTVFVLPAAACATLEAPLVTRRVYELSADDATAVAAFGQEAERHGALWYRADGTRLEPAAAADLVAVVRLLAVAPAVAGYGPLPAGAAPVRLTGPGGAIALHAARGEYALDGRPVRYRLPDELCRRFAAACR